MMKDVSQKFLNKPSKKQINQKHKFKINISFNRKKIKIFDNHLKSQRFHTNNQGQNQGI